MNSIQKRKAQEIAEAIGQLGQDLFRVGRMIADGIDDDPGLIDAIIEICPHLTESHLRRLEAVGRKAIAPALFWSEQPGVRALRRLPLETQEQYASEPVTLLLADGETLQVEVGNLQTNQAAQVFAPDHIRTPAEQRAWLEEQKAVAARSAIKPLEQPYQVKGRTIFFRQDTQLTAGQLARILADMEK